MTVRCPDCGLLYVPDSLEDARYHRSFHAETVNGLRARSIKTDSVIFAEGNLRITVVSPFSPIAQRRRAERVAVLANRETPFDFAAYDASEPPDERDVHVFLVYERDRAIGLLVVEKCRRVCRCSWPEWEANEKPEELSDHPPIWTVCMLWVLARHRRRGLATALLQAGARHVGADVESMAWYPPFTEPGEALARACCPRTFYLAK